MWYYSKENEIRRDDACLDYAGGLKNALKPNQIITFPCHGDRGNQEWIIGDVSLLLVGAAALDSFQDLNALFTISFISSLFFSLSFFILLIYVVAEPHHRAQAHRLMPRVYAKEGAGYGSMRFQETRPEMELEG